MRDNPGYRLVFVWQSESCKQPHARRRHRLDDLRLKNLVAEKRRDRHRYSDRSPDVVWLSRSVRQENTYSGCCWLLTLLSVCNPLRNKRTASRQKAILAAQSVKLALDGIAENLALMGRLPKRRR